MSGLCLALATGLTISPWSRSWMHPGHNQLADVRIVARGCWAGGWGKGTEWLEKTLRPECRPLSQMEQFFLQVSTKTGLDSTGAWHAWGMACLKAGNLAAAREKFSRCLKPPLDLNQLSHGSRLVQDVVEYLESTVRPLVSLVRAKRAERPVL